MMTAKQALEASRIASTLKTKQQAKEVDKLAPKALQKAFKCIEEASKDGQICCHYNCNLTNDYNVGIELRKIINEKLLSLGYNIENISGDSIFITWSE